jgi:hypothetical protein
MKALLFTRRKMMDINKTYMAIAKIVSDAYIPASKDEKRDVEFMNGPEIKRTYEAIAKIVSRELGDFPR